MLHVLQICFTDLSALVVSSGDMSRRRFEHPPRPARMAALGAQQNTLERAVGAIFHMAPATANGGGGGGGGGAATKSRLNGAKRALSLQFVAPCKPLKWLSNGYD